MLNRNLAFGLFIVGWRNGWDGNACAFLFCTAHQLFRLVWLQPASSCKKAPFVACHGRFTQFWLTRWFFPLLLQCKYIQTFNHLMDLSWTGIHFHSHILQKRMKKYNSGLMLLWQLLTMSHQLNYCTIKLYYQRNSFQELKFN